MKKFLFAVSFLALSSVAFADPAVNVTSFLDLGAVAIGHMGEVCGAVTGMAGSNSVMVRLVVDPNTNVSGVYAIQSDSAGNFCTIVMTETGTVQAGFDTVTNAGGVIQPTPPVVHMTSKHSR